jgi:hypothetical protein
MMRNGLGGLVLGLLVAVPALAEESWDAIYMGTTKVGYTHVNVNPVTDSTGRKLLRVQVNTVLGYKRGRDRVSIEMRYGTIETAAGAVLRLDVRALTGNDELRTYGDVVDGIMKLKLEGGGQHQQTPIPWADDVFGPYAAEMSLARQPIKPGESRTLRMFVPILNQVCETKLDAKDREPVVLGGGITRSLLRVEQTVKDKDGKPLTESDQTLWIDDGGQVLKSHSPFLGGIDSYRTNQAAARAPNGSFDLLQATIFRVDRPISDPTASRRAVYQLRLKEGDLAAVFPNDQRQTLTPTASDTGRLVVITDSPQAGTTGAATVGPEYLRANPLINSDDFQVIDHTQAAVGRISDPWSRAVAIQQWVWKNMRKKNFETVFASAKEVARNLEGDCTEHGVLTAAMCRAAGVPCRVVVGLVYVPSLGGFGPHLWNEVYVNGRWVAIDATFNQSAVDATHLKFAESSLDGVAPFEAFLPVMRVLEKLKIEPVETR